jgi:hypothetical protein
MSGLRGVFLDNLGLKILSLAIAFILWLVVFRGGQSVEQVLTVPLRVLPEPSSVVINQSTYAVKLRIEGAPVVLRQLMPADLIARVPIPRGRTGHFTLAVEPGYLNLPRDVRVTNLAPPSVTITVEHTKNKRVRIVADIVGKPAPGFKVAEWKAQPATIEVVGAESEVKAIKEVQTEPVDVSGAKEALLRQVPLAQTGKPTVLPTQDVLVKIRVGIVAEEPPAKAPRS